MRRDLFWPTILALCALVFVLEGVYFAIRIGQATGYLPPDPTP